MIRDPRTLDLIHRLKYGRQIHLAAGLASMIDHAFCDPRMRKPLEQHWPLIPVPLHRARKQQRHFNQAEEIARALSQRTGLATVNALARIRATETQTALTRSQRLANLRSAFAITTAGRRMLRKCPQGVILVDDVLTTGATADACARVLKRAGFLEVCVVVVMRG